VLAQSTNNSPHEDMSLQSDTLTSPVFTLTPYCHVISGEEAHSYCIMFELTRHSVVTALTITSQRLLSLSLFLSWR